MLQYPLDELGREDYNRNNKGKRKPLDKSKIFNYFWAFFLSKIAL